MFFGKILKVKVKEIISITRFYARFAFYEVNIKIKSSDSFHSH